MRHLLREKRDKSVGEEKHVMQIEYDTQKHERTDGKKEINADIWLFIHIKARINYLCLSGKQCKIRSSISNSYS